MANRIPEQKQRQRAPSRRSLETRARILDAAERLFAERGFEGASVRDIAQMETITGFKAWVRDWHPSYNYDNMLVAINRPTRIGEATVLPGDVVLAKREGVMFIPPALAEEVCKTAELVQLRDMFGFLRIKEGTYTPGQIDQRWSDEMEKDFSQWLNEHMDELPVPKEQIQELLKERTW